MFSIHERTGSAVGSGFPLKRFSVILQRTSRPLPSSRLQAIGISKASDSHGEAFVPKHTNWIMSVDSPHYRYDLLREMRLKSEVSSTLCKEDKWGNESEQDRYRWKAGNAIHWQQASTFLSTSQTDSLFMLGSRVANENYDLLLERN